MLAVVIRLVTGDAVARVHWIEERLEGRGVMANRAGLTCVGAQKLEST